MSVLMSGDDLLQRRAEIAASPDLTALRAYLEDEVARVLAHPLYVPEAKALLSRWGGACRDDGAELVFDPFTPRAQACSKCGRIWSGDEQHRWWVTWYQLWLAERVLLMALLSGEGGNRDAGARAADTLAAVVARYESWPNADNVLGPTRPFFSTYLESVWLLHLVAAAGVLDDLRQLPSGFLAEFKRRLVRTSAAIIADFDEGRSNRQVWNAAALYAAGRLLDDQAMCREAARGTSGIVASLEANILADGLWYEGENYHWFALRGLLWGAELLRAAGEVNLWTDSGTAGSRLRAACRAPLLTVLPDFTFPARRDSKFGVSLRQRRMAEVWELALARTDAQTGGRADAQCYASVLAHVYDPQYQESADVWREVTDVERAAPPSGVRRTRLGWKALAWAPPELPSAPEGAWRVGTANLESTGLAIFRRNECRTYVSLDYGESGGGHGHPDRLNLTAVLNGVPWLLDFGTGSYVARSLAWYRSTLAHNAPLLDGISQLPGNGAAAGFDEQGAWGWICGVLPESSVFDNATIQRTVVVGPAYVLDILQMRSESGERQLALPWHGLGDFTEDGDGLLFTNGEHRLRIHLAARQPFSVMRQTAPGPPPATPGETASDLDFAIAFATGDELTLAACLDWDDAVQELECVNEDFLVRLADGDVHVHRATDDGWHVELEHGDPVTLGGLRDVPDGPADRRTDGPDAPRPPASSPLTLDRAEQFRRAEEPWAGPDAFSATATVRREDDELAVEVDVTQRAPWFRPPGDNPEWENENPDIHSSGIQVYVEGNDYYGWLIVPVVDDPSSLRVAAVSGTNAEVEMISGSAWSRTPNGYRMAFHIVLPEPPEGAIGFDLYVNAAREGRERRTGQLVLSGARGTRLYLAGDRALPGPLPRVTL